MNALEKVLLWGMLSVLAIGVLAFIALIGAVPTYFLWNWLLPDLFDLPRLTFWQAWGIFWLVSILFKGTSSSSSK